VLSLHITVPIACFRKGMAREYLETELLPPPSTCYGMLLSLVGETDRRQHIGARVTAGILGETETSVVLRTVWRVKAKPLGSQGNARPDFQQLLTGASRDQPFIELVIHLDSSEERDQARTLEQRVATALDPTKRHEIIRWGGLSLGESTHMVDSISVFAPSLDLRKSYLRTQRAFLANDHGAISLPVWVDHVGSAGTRYVIGELSYLDMNIPLSVARIPKIEPLSEPERKE
jgi:CRISPR-associated protein Cas5t